MKPPAMNSIMLAAMLSGCATGTASKAPAVTGEATYRERIAMPPGTRFEAVLEDVSLADAPSVRIGEQIIEDAGQPPYTFSIRYDPAGINPAHTYAVRTRLYLGDRLLYTSDTHTPVITRGNPSDVRIVMKAVRAPAAAGD